MTKLAKIAALLLLLSCPQAATALDIPEPGDFFMISRNTEGTFSGAHKIYAKESEGLRLVTYCRRQYWVRPVTVAWTEVEVDNKRIVRVEHNRGKGWRPVCENPEQQVTLADLGIDLDARQMLMLGDENYRRGARFKKILSSFNAEKASK